MGKSKARHVGRPRDKNKVPVPMTGSTAVTLAGGDPARAALYDLSLIYEMPMGQLVFDALAQVYPDFAERVETHNVVLFGDDA